MLKRTKNSVVKVQEVKSRASNHHTHLMRWRNKEKKREKKLKIQNFLASYSASHTHIGTTTSTEPFLFFNLFTVVCECVCVSAFAWVHFTHRANACRQLTGLKCRRSKTHSWRLSLKHWPLKRWNTATISRYISYISKVISMHHCMTWRCASVPGSNHSKWNTNFCCDALV